MQLRIYIALNDAEHDDNDKAGVERCLWTWKLKKPADSVLRPLTILEVITPCVVYKHVKNKQWPWADSTQQNNFKACSVV